MQMLFSLGLIILILLIFLWILKKFMSARIEQVNKTSAIKILETRPLTQKTTLYILEMYDKNFAIADSLNGVTFLGEIHHKIERGSKKDEKIID